MSVNEPGQGIVGPSPAPASAQLAPGSYGPTHQRCYSLLSTRSLASQTLPGYKHAY